MVDQVKPIQSVRRKCVVLGFRRQSYYRRKQGHRPEELDQEIAELLHQVVKRLSPGASGWSFITFASRAWMESQESLSDLER